MLRFVKPEDLLFEWERVRPGLAEVKKHTSENWLPEDVYMALKTGHASLHIGEDKHGDYIGFLVLQVQPMFHGKKLTIWAAYSATKLPLMRRFFPEIQAIANAVGASRIGFTSSRQEWGKAAEWLGFKAGDTHFEMTI